MNCYFLHAGCITSAAEKSQENNKAQKKSLIGELAVGLDMKERTASFILKMCSLEETTKGCSEKFWFKLVNTAYVEAGFGSSWQMPP